MGDCSPVYASSKNFHMPSNVVNKKKMLNKNLVASSQGTIVHKAAPLKPLRLGGKATCCIVFFLLKIAALETVRRLSRARWPVVWRSIQVLQVVSYLPFKWIQRWTPLGIIVKGVQKSTRPLLFISIASAFSDHSENSKKAFDSVDDSQSQCVSCSSKSTSDMGSSSEVPNSIIQENWLLQLHEELEKQGISLPERIDEDEIRRFYAAANGDFSFLLSSLKRTIHWRETYCILSLEELEMWSHLVFWHGSDVLLRPCLIVRLGLACSSLRPYDRPLFAQAVVSQIEHGALHLVSEDNPRITVLLDCEGLTPFRFPMHMIKSCSTLLQEHYPGRLGKLFVVRLPPVVRVIAQTFIQVLKPAIRQKLSVEGETYQKALSEFLQSVPAFLGGNCTCSKCDVLPAGNARKQIERVSRKIKPVENVTDGVSTINAELSLNGDHDHALRAVIIGILVVWIVIAFAAGMHDLEPLKSFLKVLP